VEKRVGVKCEGKIISKQQKDETIKYQAHDFPLRAKFQNEHKHAGDDPISDEIENVAHRSCLVRERVDNLRDSQTKNEVNGGSGQSTESNSAPTVQPPLQTSWRGL
jgi:hypothetical protein